jgi:hypothetical protein
MNYILGPGDEQVRLQYRNIMLPVSVEGVIQYVGEIVSGIGGDAKNKSGYVHIVLLGQGNLKLLSV